MSFRELRAALDERFTEAELNEHAIQLGAIGMCGINRELWETRREINLYIERHFRPARAALSGSATEQKESVTQQKVSDNPTRQKAGE